MKKAQNILNTIGTIAGVVSFLTTGINYGISASEKIKGLKAQKAELKASDDFDDLFEENVNGKTN